MLANVKDWKTTIIGVLLILASLPTMDWIAPIISLNPKVGKYVLGIAGIAGGLISIFGTQSKKPE
jgi:hypothetical protein